MRYKFNVYMHMFITYALRIILLFQSSLFYERGRGESAKRNAEKGRASRK